MNFLYGFLKHLKFLFQTSVNLSTNCEQRETKQEQPQTLWMFYSHRDSAITTGEVHTNELFVEVIWTGGTLKHSKAKNLCCLMRTLHIIYRYIHTYISHTHVTHTVYLLDAL